MMQRALLVLCTFVSVLVALPLRADDTQIWRIPGALPDMNDPTVKGLFGNALNGGKPLNIVVVSALTPKMSRAKNDYVAAIRFDGVVPGADRELAILRTAAILGSKYEFAQHTSIARACGLTDAQLGALADWRAAKLFNDKQRALLAFVDEMSNNKGHVDDRTFARVQSFYTPREIVELANAISMYYATGLFTNTLEIRLETDGRAPTAGKC